MAAGVRVLTLAAYVAAIAVIIGWSRHDVKQVDHRLTVRNCVANEQLKAILRPKPFNLVQTRKVLTQIGIDPLSVNGKDLIRQGRDTNRDTRAVLAPKACPK